MKFKDAKEQLLRPGVVGILPTDTVYGLVAIASDEVAVKRLYSLKHRRGKPGTVIAANIKQLEELGLKHRYLKAVEQYWPGAVSVIIPTSEPSLAYLHQGLNSLAVRLPAGAELNKLLVATGPLLTSSANPEGRPTAVKLSQAQSYFGDQVDFCVDGGEYKGEPSTIIRILDDAVEVVRPGAVKIQE